MCCRARPAYKLQRAGGNCKDGTQKNITRLVPDLNDLLLLIKFSQSALPGRLGVKPPQHKMVHKEHLFTKLVPDWLLLVDLAKCAAEARGSLTRLQLQVVYKDDNIQTGLRMSVFCCVVKFNQVGQSAAGPNWCTGSNELAALATFIMIGKFVHRDGL
jgi:hypothetical protein